MTERRRLPDERASITRKFRVADVEGYYVLGLYEDGTLGEIFIVFAKENSALTGVYDAFALAASLALQQGTPLRKLIEKFKGIKFEPSGSTNDPEFKTATSILDLIFRQLERRFIKQDKNGDNHE